MNPPTLPAPSPAPVAKPNRTPRLFRSLSSRNYRFYFLGQTVSMIGNWMSQTASLWLAYKLTGSPLLVGVVGFAGQAPIFLLAPLAGVWADRVDRHRLLLLTQVLSALQIFTLAALTFRHALDIRLLVALAFAQGAINAFDFTTRHAILTQLVPDKEHLPSAIALNSSVFNMARLVGPALGGAIVARFGAGFCYALDGLSYLAMVAALGLVRLPRAAAPAQRPHPWHEFGEGIRYVLRFPAIRLLMGNVALNTLWAFSFSTLAPVFAREVFHGDARTLGAIMSASGIGSLAAALYLGSRATLRTLAATICCGGLVMGLGLIAYASLRSFPAALLALVAVGAGNILLLASSNTLVQSAIADDKRGRTMSLYTFCFNGAASLGSLLCGSLAGVLGGPAVVRIGGVLALAAAFSFWLRLPRLHRAIAGGAAPPPPAGPAE